jgi:WD40 repeat protein
MLSQSLDSLALKYRVIRTHREGFRREDGNAHADAVSLRHCRAVQGSFAGRDTASVHRSETGRARSRKGSGVGSFIRIWDLKTEQTIRELHGHNGDVTSISLSADGKLLASASADTTVRLWKADTWDQVKVLGSYRKSANRVAWAPERDLLASCSDDGVR